VEISGVTITNGLTTPGTDGVDGTGGVGGSSDAGGLLAIVGLSSR